MNNNDNKMTEISNEAFLLALIDSLSTTPKQEIAELKAIIADEMKNPVLKRDYKIIFECRFEIRKCKKKMKEKSSKPKAEVLQLINSYLRETVKHSETEE